MKISLNWLKSICPDFSLSVDDLCILLTNRGIEIEAVEQLSKGLEKVFVGKIIEKQKHPDAEKLSVLKVDMGNEISQIVCGASNMKTGDKVAVATIGANLPNGLLIKKTKIRGVESCGMCCSMQELGLDSGSDGIIICPDSAAIASNIAEIFSIDDVILEVSTSPNRGDLLSHRGIAREIFSVNCKENNLTNNFVKNTQKKTGGLSVSIQDQRCSRYIGKLFKGVKILESPDWLRKRIEAIGLRSINNIVDISNYVMFEYGHPLHVFDAALVSNHSIIVRASNPDEFITLLDDAKIELKNNELIIADDKKPLALAGIKGGKDSGVFENTIDLILECAYFEPKNIRITAKKHNISTDSSYRFERGVDFFAMPDVVEKASSLIVELANPSDVFDTLDIITNTPELKTISIEADKLCLFLGIDIETKKIIDLLSSIDFKIEEKNNVLLVSVPSYRNDVILKEDIYEEVARLIGYDKIPATLPFVSINFDAAVDLKQQNLSIKIREVMKYLGYLEAITYSFVPKAHHEFLEYSNEQLVSILNPIADTMKFMRKSMVTSLLDVVKYNLNHRNLDFKIFEIGKTYSLKNTEYSKPDYNTSVVEETEHLCGVLTAKNKFDFFTAKRDLSMLFSYLRIPNWNLVKFNGSNFLNSGQAARIICCGKDIGYIGKVSSDLLKNFDIENADVFVFDLQVQLIEKNFLSNIAFKEIPKFPFIRRDLSFLIKEQYAHSEIMSCIKKTKAAFLQDYGLFDLYKGENIPNDKKSVAYYFIFNSMERTLLDQEVERAMKQVSNSLIKEFSVEIR